MPDSTLQQAIKEAYAAAPSNVIIYSTLELRHPAFITPIRVVRDYRDLVAGLESGLMVTFTAFSFNVTEPEITPDALPEVQIEMDNVDRSIVASIEAAIATTDLITCIYRKYVSTDLSGPQNNPPLSLTITSVTADVFKVTATASFLNLMNVRFPRTEYDPQTFPGLTA